MMLPPVTFGNSTRHDQAADEHNAEVRRQAAQRRQLREAEEKEAAAAELEAENAELQKRVDDAEKERKFQSAFRIRGSD